MLINQNVFKIVKLLKNQNECDFSGGVNTQVINDLEIKLKVKFPESYRWFLENFGSGGSGFEIEGIYENTSGTLVYSVENITEEYREYGLPDNLIVIETAGGENQYCLDISLLENGECPVVSWGMDSQIAYIKYNSFLEYFYDNLKETINNL